MGRIKKGQTYGHVKVNVWNTKWYYKPSLHKWIPFPQTKARHCKECGIPTEYCYKGTWLCPTHLVMQRKKEFAGDIATRAVVPLD